MKRLVASPALLALFVSFVQSAFAWDYEGHRLVNQLALASLPDDFPAFVKAPAAAERVAYLAGEPDRWRNVSDVPLRHVNGPDHYIDLEQLDLYALKPEMLPVFRYDFVAELAIARKAHPEKFPEINSSANEDHTRQLVGFLPWSITENYSKLKSGFSSLKAFEEGGGTPEEISNAQQNIIYVMGVMGHYVGDGAQPLHTTVHHHGWVGDNPHEYTTKSTFHSWIDGGYFRKIGIATAHDLQGKLRPAGTVMIGGHPAKPEEMFQAVMLYLLEQLKQVEPLYKLEKDGKLSGEGDTGMQGRAFLEGQMIKGAQMLGDIWYSAWQQAPPDSYLKTQLARRKKPAAAEETKPKASQ